MIAVASLLVVLTLALLTTRVATVALRTTGLSQEAARFQARSAISGVGFTTTESEDIVNHPARRRIVLTLMLLSSAGVITTLASLLLSFTGTSGYRQSAMRALALAAGLLVLWCLAASDWVEIHLSRLIQRLILRFTDLEVQDYVRLLHIYDDYSIAEIAIDPDDWLQGRPIEALKLAAEGVVVLGIRDADGQYTGAPAGTTALQPGDVVIVYGRTAALDELHARQAGADGDLAHARQCVEHRRIVSAEQGNHQDGVPVGGNGHRRTTRRAHQ